MTQTISLLIPTRLRPSQLRKMVESARHTAQNPELLQFCFYIDFDDNSYESLLSEYDSIDFRIVRGPRMWLSSMFNNLLTVASGDFLFWSGDDVEFLTDGWDAILKEAILMDDEKLTMVHVDDMSKTYAQSFATIGMVHSNWVQIFGYLFTPHMRDNGIDFWITDVANQVNSRKYISAVKIQHLQYRQGNAEIDQTYKDRLIDHQTYDPASLYGTLFRERRRDALLLASHKKQFKIRTSRNFLIARTLIYIFSIRHVDFYTTNRAIYLGAFSNIDFLKKVLIKMRLHQNPNLWR